MDQVNKRLTDLSEIELEELLLEIDQSGFQISLAGKEPVATTDLRELADSLKHASPKSDNHFDLQAIMQLAETRSEQGDQWEMPEHLSKCTLCLEAYEATLVDLSPAVALSRYEHIFNERKPATAATSFNWSSNLFRIAAALVFLLAAGAGFYHLSNKTTAVFNSGDLIRETGKALTQGEAVPAGANLLAKESAVTGFADGSKVDINKDTRLSFGNALPGAATINLQEGSIKVSAAKQKQGRTFNVRTPFGEVVVIGTQFTVAYGKEEVVVYESNSGGQPRKEMILTMNVNVLEGTVLMKNKHEKAFVKVGETATLRQNNPHIQVLAGSSR